MSNILLKYNFIKIIPFEDTFFYTSTLPKNLRFSQDLLKLNYSKYSPFEDPNILSSFKNEQLMIWFYKIPVKESVIIPESYILFNELKKQNKDAVYILNDDIVKILVIKKNKLLAIFTLDSLDETILNLSMDEYQISNKINIEKKEFNQIYKEALNNLTLREIYQWNQLSLDTKSISKKLVSKVSYPLSALVLFTILVNYIHNSNLKNDIKILKDKYFIVKNKNNDLRADIKQHNKDMEQWEEFIYKELIYPDSISLLNSIYSIFKEDEVVTINSMTINSGKMILRLETDLSPILFLNRLNNIIYFSQVVIGNTHKPKKGLKSITYNLDVKLLKDM